MPPIHKKGALFAVHADSPGPRTSTHHTHTQTQSQAHQALFHDENALPVLAGKAVGKQPILAPRNVLGNKGNLVPAGSSTSTSTSVQGGKKGGLQVRTQSQMRPLDKENPTQQVGGKGKGKNTDRAGLGVGLGLGLGVAVEQNGVRTGSTSMASFSTGLGGVHGHRRGKSGEQKTIKSRLFGTSSNSNSASTSLSNNGNTATVNLGSSKDKDARPTRPSSAAHSSLIAGLRNSPVRHLLSGKAGSSRGNVLAGRQASVVPAPVTARSVARPVDDVEEEEEDVYSRPVTRKQKKTAAPVRSSTATEAVVENVFLPTSDAGVKAPMLPYTSTFDTPLPDTTPDLDHNLGGFALPAFPAPLTGGLFGPNKVVGADARVKTQGLFGARGGSSRGKENVPPLGERVLGASEAGETRTHRSLGSAFSFEPIAEVELPDRPFGAPTSPSPRKRFARSDSKEDGTTAMGNVHGLGFGFTPCRASPIASTSARRHQRGVSSASGINHFLPHSHSSGSGSGLGENSESSFEKAKMTPLKQRSKKRASEKKSGSSGHRRGASSMSMTNHFLPTASSSEFVGRSIETSPMARAKVTPLKSRRKHVRQKSSLSRGFSFGSNHVGLGFDMSVVGAPIETVEYGDEELGDMQSTPSVWESASSKRSSNTTSSLGSTSKRFWGLDVQAEDDEGEGAEGFLTGSPVSRRKSGSPSRMSLFTSHAMLPSSAHGWVQTNPGEFQAPPPPAPRRKGKGKLFR